MSERDAFGPNLRRRRVRAGISLEDLARQTRVSVDMWEALERNDFSRWPSGIYARAYVRVYASAIGLDLEETVNDFCRGFPQGDRRAQGVVRGTADIVGHDLVWRDDLPPSVPRDRRVKPDAPSAERRQVRRVRLLAVGLDLLAVGVASGATFALFRGGIWTIVAVMTVSYFAASLALLGSTLGGWVVDTYADTHPEFASRGHGFLFGDLHRLPRTSGRFNDAPSPDRRTFLER